MSSEEPEFPTGQRTRGQGQPALASLTPQGMGSQVLYRCELGFSSCFLQAVQTLEFYSCSSEEIDHEDITKDKTSTVEACLPQELTTVGTMLLLPKRGMQGRAAHQTSRSHSDVHVSGPYHCETCPGPTSKLDLKKICKNRWGFSQCQYVYH